MGDVAYSFFGHKAPFAVRLALALVDFCCSKRHDELCCILGCLDIGQNAIPVIFQIFVRDTDVACAWSCLFVFMLPKGLECRACAVQQGNCGTLWGRRGEIDPGCPG